MPPTPQPESKPTTRQLDKGPFVITSIALGELYEKELDNLIESIDKVYAENTNRNNITVLLGSFEPREGRAWAVMHHYDLDRQELTVWDAWQLPEAFDKIFDMNSHDVWWAAVCLKGWWIWEMHKRAKKVTLVWIDADATLQKPLDLTVPKRSFLGAHWVDFDTKTVLHSGVLVLQGTDIGLTLEETAERCRQAVQEDVKQGHQILLQAVALELNCPLFPLPDSYCAIALPENPPDPEAVIQHWAAHRSRIDPNWPPPIEDR